MNTDDLVAAAQQNDAGEEVASYAVAHAAMPALHQEVGGADDTIMKQSSVVTHSQTTAPPSRSKKSQKIKFPPPSSDIIFGHNENDVLLGRGATTNSHPGNVNFRNMCAAAKPNFVVAANAEKRQIAIATAQHVMALDPPGRFLERVEGEININEEGIAIFDGMGGAYSNVDITSLISPSDAKYLNETGWGQNKASKNWRRALGPWRDVGMEKAVQKTCAVIRDHKRQDRIALKAMGLLKKSSKKNNLGVSDIVHISFNVLPVTPCCLLLGIVREVSSGRRESRILISIDRVKTAESNQIASRINNGAFHSI